MPASAVKLVPQILDKYVEYSKLKAKLLEKFGDDFDTDENIRVGRAYQTTSAGVNMNTWQLTYDWADRRAGNDYPHPRRPGVDPGTNPV